MKLKILKPTSPSKRHYLNIKNKLTKIKTLKIKSNSTYLNIILHQKKLETISAIVYSIEYDSKKNTNVAGLFNFKFYLFFYIIAPKNLKIGYIVKIGKNAEKKIGHCMTFYSVPIGCPVFNISIKPNIQTAISKSAGTFSLLLNKTKLQSLITLNSGKKKIIANMHFGFIGVASNELFFLKQLGKSGRSRWLGKFPKVRGSAMNPVDHPNGGGEGKKSSQNKNLWGRIKNSKKGKLIHA